MAEAVATNISSMTLVDWLDDLTVRFLLNLPPTELSSVPRICFQIEEAQWFYEDFIRPLNPQLPSLNLRQFLLALFQHCPLLQGFDAAQHVAVYEEFLSYKTRVPVRGAILMDDSMEKVLLVRGWKKGASWSFPRGKINKDEKDLVCAIREVNEETGFDISATDLVESNLQPDGQVKSIDVTMRDQHMKLYVFRGVALDTHFEPKTRKEISKIQWYNIRDLPGFKKQKGAAGHGQGDASSSKFYMVAPFLGPLKKWIGQQRRKEAGATQAQHARQVSSANEGFQTGVTEYEGETEQELIPDAGVGPTERSADELKRLSSIGGPIPLPVGALTIQPEPVQASNQSNSLLAMLHGNQPAKIIGTLPKTPSEQIDPAFPSQPPQTPHPPNPRHPSSGQLQAQVTHHQFTLPPQHFHQQHSVQQNYPLPSGATGPGSGPSNQPQKSNFANFPPHLQRELLDQHRQHQGISGNLSQGGHVPQFEQQANAAASSFNLYQQIQTPKAQPNTASRGPQQWPFHGQAAPLASPKGPPQVANRPPGLVAQTTQNAQKPLGSESSVPEASSLPQPRLNAHSMELLEVLKSVGGNNAATTSASQRHAQNGQKAGSQQQAALLNLFKKTTLDPEPAQPPAAEGHHTPAPVSPALTDATVKPATKKTERRTTFNEITRTLPPKTKSKSPELPIAGPDQLSIHAKANAQPAEARTMQAPKSDDFTEGRPMSRGKLYNPANPQKFVRASSQSKKPEPGSMPPVATLQKQPARAPPKTQQNQTTHENGQPTPQFSILQRPGSSTGGGPRSPLPQKPLRQEANAPAFQPQVLKRPSTGTYEGERPSSVSHENGDGKKDHLLSLFGKPTSSATPPPPASPQATVTTEPQRSSQHHSGLLSLFNGKTGALSTAKTPEPTPPPAPQLVPERKPSQQATQAHGGPQQQQLLLNLFNKQSSSAASSPGTPISPFMLGYPMAKESPHIKQQLPLPGQALVSRSRLGSIASNASNGTPRPSGQQTPTSATPTAETKDFLLGYLNGVVQKEGSRSSRRQQ
ncbi:mRNA decapping complex subunit 2 [Lecanosticta acicola]|uniref:mRNA decapping complex subunit 2 n=1 Tax=Lecanosticta acicola TaxID=111012 RepID=A0AAI8YS28_9PEZI|nr:mRNA decapping complex subunit 2 [Lecanosticta acicola]